MLTFAVAEHAPDLIIAPMLKVAIPEAIWSQHKCLIVHPGIKGDRGPSSLDWAPVQQPLEVTLIVKGVDTFQVRAPAPYRVTAPPFTSSKMTAS